jgi:hypothetical protein
MSKHDETASGCTVEGLVRTFVVRGECSTFDLSELCDKIETLAHEMRQIRNIGNAETIMHLAADVLVSFGANV